MKRLEQGLTFHLAVSTIQAGEDMVDHNFITARLAIWRSANALCGLTGAPLISGYQMVHVLEGTAAAIYKQRWHLNREPMHTDIRQLAAGCCLERRFEASPLSYIPSSRWVERALTYHPSAEMVADSPTDAKFLIDLMLDFVGDAA